MSQPVLHGLRVLDAGTMIGGPFAATLLADYGADVIKIEKPATGDTIREWSPIKDGLSLWWKVIARNKRLVTLDLRTKKGKAVFLKLVEAADVVIENYRPGTFAQWGYSYPELSRINKKIILVHVSGYGQTGPYASLPGYGTIAEGISGIPAFTGFPDKPPTLSAFPLADSLAAVFGCLGLLSAIYERDVQNSGRGQEIDVSLYEPLFRLVESQVIGFDQLGIIKQRRGNRLEEDSPRNAYPTADGEWITISASSDRTFGRLAAAIGRPELAQDPKFERNAGRIVHDAELDDILGAWIANRTADEVTAELKKCDVISGRIYDIEDIFEDPQYQARQDIVSVPDADFGSVKMPNVFPKFSRSECRVEWSGGRLGEHNEDVFGGLLGLSEPELQEMRLEGII